MQVISSEKIEDSDNYNVTVNMIIKKGNKNQLEKDEKPPTKSLELITVYDQPVKVEEAIASVQEPVVAPVPTPAPKPVVILAPKPSPAPVKHKIVITPKKTEKSPDSNSNFLAAASLFGTEQ